MKRFSKVLLVSLMFGVGLCLASVRGASAQVTCKEGTLTLPTLSLGPYNPNPHFDTYQDNWPYPYPYTYLYGDKIESLRTYKAIVLENKYLRIAVLPGLGGRIYSVYDKINKHEMLHSPTQVTIDYQNDVAGGTYVGLGVELSMPDHHSLTNARHREYKIIDNPDGSKTIAIGELELRYGMRWAIDLTLKPGIACMFVKATIQNQANTNGRFRYWENNGIDIDHKDIEFIIPENGGWEHGGGYGPVSWPIYDGVDMRYPNKLPQTLGLEARDVHDGFVAYYNHTDNFGYVHWADPGVVKGKKYWTWGASAHALHRAYLFGDGKIFMEMQAGLDEDQESFDILEPFGSRSWNEVWYPVDNLGTVTEAGKTVAMALATGMKPETPVKNLSLNIQSTVPYKNMHVTVSLKNGVIGSTDVHTEPAQVERVDVPLSKEVTLEDSVRVTFTNDEEMLLTHVLAPLNTHDMYIGNVANPAPPAPERTTDYLMSQVRRELRYHRQPKYGVAVWGLLEEVLHKDPDHSEALKVKGIFEYERGLFDSSIADLEHSLVRNPFDGETYYYLGLNYYQQHHWDKAHFAFSYAVKYGRFAGFFFLSMIDLVQHDTSDALAQLKSAVDYNPDNTRVRFTYALLLDRLGKTEEARDQVKQANARFPMDPLNAVAEYYIDNKTVSGFDTSSEGKQVTIQLHGSIQTYYAMVLNLMEMGWNKEALNLLNEAETACAHSAGLGMIPYYKRSLYLLLGEKQKAEDAVKNISTESIVYTFPFRLQEQSFLESDLKEHTDDPYAWYYLGLIKGGFIRYQEAYEDFQKAESCGLAHPVLFDILGKIAYKTFDDVDTAIYYYKESLAMDSNNVFTVNALADMYKIKNDTLSLYALSTNPLTYTNQDLVEKYIQFLVRQDKLDLAINTLKNKVNFPHMAQELYPYYSEVCVDRGIELLDAKKYDEAIRLFESALHLRKNFGYLIWLQHYDLRAEYFLGLAYKESGNLKKAEEIWNTAINQREQYQDWTIGGDWDFGFWIDRFYQGWMLKELGKTAEAVTYFDALRSTAAHKFPLQWSTYERTELLKMAYNGLNDSHILTGLIVNGFMSRN